MDPYPFKDRVIAVTGGASGIGLATAHLLASRGANLSLADLSADGLEKARADIEAKHKVSVLVYSLDVRTYSQVEDWISQTLTKYGRLDGAANLAGVIPRTIGMKGVDEQDFDEWDFVLDINLKGLMHCLRAQLRVMKSGASIVNAASIASLQGRPNLASYSASKHGVLGLTRSSAKEVGKNNVRVNCICPGRIDTPMSMSALKTGGEKYEQSTVVSVALGRTGQPEEVAKLIAFLLSDESTYITGVAYSIDGGWNC